MTKLENKIKYKFKNIKNLDLALIHKSVTHDTVKNNQRLEFLGDSILGLIISKYLYDKFPSYNDGELTRLKALLVKKERLAELGKELFISDFLKYQNQKNITNSMIEDTIEAIIGAIFIDSDFNTVQKVVIDLFEKYFMNIIISRDFLKQKVSATVRLKEYSEKKYKIPPEIIFVKKEGKDNNAILTMIVKVGNLIEKANGKSKKEAIFNASQKILNKLKL